MGAWGVSLYSGDFAQDLRASVTAVARLPFDAERLLEYLCATEPTAANNPTDFRSHDLLADHRRSIRKARDRLRPRARKSAGDHRGRRRPCRHGGARHGRQVAREAQGHAGGAARAHRRASGRPAAQASQIAAKAASGGGEVLTYPICDGAADQPLYDRQGMGTGEGMAAGRLGALVIAECGLAFDYLAWYRPLVICEPFLGEPSLAELREPRMWLLRNPGILTGRHIATMRMKSLGRIEVDPARLSRFFPERMSPSAAS